MAAGSVAGWPAAGAGGMACGAATAVPWPVIFWPGLLACVYVCARVICWSWARMIGGPVPPSWAGAVASSARVYGRGYACRGDLPELGADDQRAGAGVLLAGPAVSSARVRGCGYACRGDLLELLPGWPAAAGHPGPRVEIQKFSPKKCPGCGFSKNFPPTGEYLGHEKNSKKPLDKRHATVL